LLVLAGAGSGKTRVITRKIAFLIRHCHMNPAHIAAVTFTNKAAREMKGRIGQLIRKETSRGLQVSTFHTLGLRIIRQEMETLGLKHGFSIFDNHDSTALLTELLRSSSVDQTDLASKVLAQISRWKSALVEPKQALAAAHNDAGVAMAAKLYEQYNQHLRTCNGVDFDDLIMLPVSLFRTRPDILLSWQGRIRYLLVDEYQDTNATQYEMVKLLAGEQQAFTVVGDDDQSIYAWRGAQPENLALLQQDFPRLKVIKLEQNYRSMGRILKAANHLIRNNSRPFEKALWSELGHGEELKVLCAENEADEAEKTIGRISHHRFMNRTRWNDYAILYRSNHQSRLFEKALREQDIPYRLSGGTSFFSYSEVRDIMAYLRLLVNQEDDNAFLRIVNTPRRGIGPGTVEKLAGWAGSRKTSLFSASFDMALTQHLGTRAIERLLDFATWLGKLSEQAEGDDPISSVRQLVRDIDYADWLETSSKDPKTAERRMKNVNELVDWLEHMHRQDERSGSLADLVTRMTLIDMLDRNDNDENDNSVQLMTIHAAKGLEFSHVFLVGMEENILPHKNSIELDDVEEERRLAYVAITRARETLTFSRVLKRSRYGEVSRCEPSRFLSELPQEDLRREGQQQDVEANTATGKQTLKSLRELLQQT